MASNRFYHASRKSAAMGPCVRNLLSHYQLNPGQINSTGPHQVILKSDVVAYISQHNLQPAKLEQQTNHSTTSNSKKAGVFTPNLDISGYQPKAGPEGFSKIAKEILGM